MPTSHPTPQDSSWVICANLGTVVLRSALLNHPKVPIHSPETARENKLRSPRNLCDPRDIFREAEVSEKSKVGLSYCSNRVSGRVTRIPPTRNRHFFRFPRTSPRFGYLRGCGKPFMFVDLLILDCRFPLSFFGLPSQKGNRSRLLHLC